MNTLSNVFQNLFAAQRHTYSNYIDIYTDGSKAGNLVGCGIVCENKTLSSAFYHLFLFFPVEVLTIEIALNFLSPLSHIHFIIYPDSKSAIDSLQSGSCSPTYILILNLYNELSRKRYDILFWIPGHNGIKGNENANRAAKHASSTLNAAIPYSDLKYAIGKYIKSK